MNLAATLNRVLHAGFLPLQESLHVHGEPPEHRSLPKNAMLALENRRLQLRVLSGCVWITRDGCRADTVLGAGEVFEQRPGAPVLVQALDEVELLLAG